MNQTPVPAFADWSLVGAHNANLDTSTLRIMEGKSWAKTNTIIVMPCGRTTPTKPVFALMNLLSPPNQSCPKIPLIGMEVGEAYSNAFEQFARDPQFKDFKYVLTIEHDNTPPSDGLLTLIKHMEAHPEFACIGGLYWTKGPGGVPQIWGDIKDPMPNWRPQPPDPRGGLVECWGTGMGFNLWRLDMFKDPRFPRPLFKTKCSKDEGVGTQDLTFWSEAKKLGYRCAIACDVLVGHYDVNEDKTW